jgi:hypothetical protein
VVTNLSPLPEKMLENDFDLRFVESRPVAAANLRVDAVMASAGAQEIFPKYQNIRILLNALWSCDRTPTVLRKK